MFDSESSSSIDDVLLDDLVQRWVAEADTADGWDEPGWEPVDDVPPPAPLSRADADALVATVLDVGPGPWAASMLLTLSADQVSEPVRFDLVRAWQAQQAWTDAQAGLALADHLGPEPADAHHDLQVPDSGIGWRMRVAETALVLRSTEATLRRRAGVAGDLAGRLPRTRGPVKKSV